MDERLKEKLRKVLAMTSSPFEAEAQTAAATLARMLEAHNLDIADLEQRGQAVKPGIKEGKHDLGKAAFNWKLDLAEEIADYYYCYPLVDRRAKTVHFVGRPDNVESLQMLYQWVIDQIRRLSTETRKEHIERTGEHIDPLRWQVAFGAGATRRLGERLGEMRRRQSSEAGSALVLSHRSEISDYFEERYGYRRDGKRTKRQEESIRRYEAEQERLRKLKEEDIEAYYNECPWERPERVEQRRKEHEAWKKREERNAKRRKGRAERQMSEDEIRRELEQAVAQRSGLDNADRINLQPFVTGKTIHDEPKKIGG